VTRDHQPITKVLTAAPVRHDRYSTLAPYEAWVAMPTALFQIWNKPRNLSDCLWRWATLEYDGDHRNAQESRSESASADHL